MKISKIYKKYKIMPQLQEHMLKVSGVASLIVNNYQYKIKKNSVISAALIHDLGNMAKIKLDRFPEFVKSEEIDYWKKVLTEFKQKYGDNDYKATYSILKELGIKQDIYDIIQSLEFAKAEQTEKGNNNELKICLYSDARVSPHGVTSLIERLDEVKTRFIKNKGVSEKKFERLCQSLYKIESEIFNNSEIKPEDITEEKVQPLINDLRKFEIETS